MFGKKKEIVWHSPEGTSYYVFCKDILDDVNTLIAGCAGSGKSELIHSIIYTVLATKFPCECENGASLWLADPKRVELSIWKDTPFCQSYASDYEGILSMLDDLIATMEWRYSEMERLGLRKWNGSKIYLVVDELGDMMTTYKREFTKKFTKLMQLSRASGIVTISATQSPSRITIPASAQINYTRMIGLRCKSSAESRQIVGIGGCENLPKYGEGLMLNSDGLSRVFIPMTAEEDIRRLKKWWATEGQGFTYK